MKTMLMTRNGPAGLIEISPYQHMSLGLNEALGLVSNERADLR